MGPKEVEAVRVALKGVDIVEIEPDRLDKGETTSMLTVSMNGSVMDALGHLAAAGLIPRPNNPHSQAPLEVASSVIFHVGDGPDRHESSGAFVLVDRPSELPIE